MTEHNKYPNVTVKIIFRVGGEIFMLRHRQDGAYDFPGGRMEWGESPEQTLARELKEELNYTLPAEPKFFSIYNYVAEDGSRHSVQLLYILELAKKPTFDIQEAADPLWLNKNYFLDHWQDPACVGRMFA